MKNTDMPDWRPKKPARTDYGIGVIGTGEISRNKHLPAYRKGGLNVRALCDINRESLEKAGKQFEIKNLYTDYRSLLEDPSIQIIDLTTQPEVREPIIMDALKSGKHLLVEKPLSHSIEQAYRYLQAVEKTNLVIAVNQTRRWYPNEARMIALVKNGIIDKPQGMFCVSVSNNDRIWGGPTWRGQLEHFWIREITIHNVETYRALSGLDPVKVNADGVRMDGQLLNSETLTNIVIEFPSDQRLYDVCQLAAQGNIKHNYWAVFGTEGSIQVERQEIIVYRKSKPDKPWHISCPEPIVDAFIDVMYNLMDCIQTGQEPETNIRGNLPTVAAVIAAGISLKERRAVEISEILKL